MRQTDGSPREAIIFPVWMKNASSRVPRARSTCLSVSRSRIKDPDAKAMSFCLQALLRLLVRNQFSATLAKPTIFFVYGLSSLSLSDFSCGWWPLRDSRREARSPLGTLPTTHARCFGR